MRGILAMVLALLTLALPTSAEVARVKSGEHFDFTRLVIVAPGVKDWSFGRRPDGYELRLDSADWQYDLTGVFDLIPRKRLASITGDPETGRLRLAIACPCHAIPFEFRPGLIVVDLRDGPPPAVSSFEQTLDETSQATVPPVFLPPRPVPRPEINAAPSPEVGGAAYNWLDQSSAPERTATSTPANKDLPLRSGGDALDPLRQALLAQMSIGLTNGIIDLAEPGTGPKSATAATTASDWSRVVLGELPEASANFAVQKAGPMTPDGSSCITDEKVSLHEWASGDPVSSTIGQIRQGLLGEFDRPDPTVLASAAQKLIYLGFGAEARQLLEAFPPEEPQPDRKILLSLARLVDGQSDPAGPFATMALCHSTAALWAVLSTDVALVPGNLNDASLRRGFSALPPHLRRALGPGLVDRFLAAKNEVAVVALRDAIERGERGGDPTLSVLDARIELSDGRPKEAETRAAKVLADPGPATAEAILALVDARTAQNAGIDVKTITTVEALLAEEAGTARDPALRRALILARFGAGDVPGAFDALSDAPWVTDEIWTLLAKRGDDSDLLTQAILPKGKAVEVAPATGAILAERLLALGLAEPALRWLGQPGPEWDAERFVVYGRGLLAAGRAQAAISALADQSTPEAMVVRAEAMVQLGMTETAARTFEEAGDPDMATAARSWAEDWAGLAKSGPENWATTALRLTTGRMEAIEADTAGALQRGADLVGNSAADRASVEALLRAVPMPGAQP